ncbi:intermembrane transport protein PqiB [Aestuariirhabdus sp. LZHN29]|uniref:PqiB family protein n=1 Tax=Aestuariirhabdus sp. LZHN29 TaxID=3417462 RepID=UPI003CF72283
MKPEVSKKRGLSKIWIVPILAAVLGAGMVVHSLVNEGPTVDISFATAADLTAGKTKVKLLNVDIGQVEAIDLNKDVSGVVVHAKLDKDYEHLLREDSLFWVERVRVGAGGISGLGTILSGAYIKLAPGTGKEGVKSYTGLESPPQTRAGAPGLRLKLVSAEVSSVSAGDQVLFQGYPVGRVETMRLDEITGKIHYDLFIDAPYHQFINSSVRFWNTSGISLNASAEGFSLRAGSLETMLSGGVAFGVPDSLSPGETVAENTTFTLYESFEAAQELTYEHGLYYVVLFKQDVGGLTPGASVTYRGVNAGRVVRIMLKELSESDRSGTGEAIPVLIYLEPGRLDMADTIESVEELKAGIKRSVPQGLRASVRTGNMLTGSQSIALDFYPTEKPQQLGTFVNYKVIPSLAGGLDSIMVSVSSFMDKLNKLPLNTTVNSANGAIGQLENSLASMDRILKDRSTRQIPQKLEETLSALRITLEGLSPESPIYRELEGTLVTLRATLEGLSPDSQLYKELEGSVYELNRTLKNMDSLTHSLKGTATMLPAPSKHDLIPEARAQ